MSVQKRKNVITEKRKDGRLRVKLSFPEKDKSSISITQQNFKKEQDINTIMKRYIKTGILGDPLSIRNANPKFGNFDNVADFHTQMNRLTELQTEFNELNSEVRNRFNNDPAELVEFLADPKNEDEARELGFLPPLTDAEFKAKYPEKFKGLTADPELQAADKKAAEAKKSSETAPPAGE